MSFRHQLLKVKLIRHLSSLKLTVTCLILLYTLVLCGTIAQVQDGLYLAQQRYFESFFFLAFGFLPFPGAQGIMWVLFVNLMCVAFTRFSYKLKNVGIIIIHCGLLLFLVSGYITLHGAKESYITLAEGQSSNVSSAYHEWELAIWEAPNQTDQSSIKRDIISLDADHFKAGQKISFNDFGFNVSVKEYFRNCDPYTGQNQNNVMNASGIVRLQPISILKEPEKNTPGGIFTITTNENKKFDVLLYGNDNDPTAITVGPKRYNLIVRMKRYPLPFIMRLKEFKKEEHPGTEMARAFQSLVEIKVDKVWREKLISMNEPLRYKEYTFYQSSFSGDKFTGLKSTLAVVKNGGRLMPYISTAVTFIGLTIHFCVMAVSSRNRSREIKENDDEI